MFEVTVEWSPSDLSTNTLLESGTRVTAEYSCPCENTGRRRSSSSLRTVRPWHPLKVTAYDRLSGICLRWTMKLKAGGWKVTSIRGTCSLIYNTAQLGMGETKLRILTASICCPATVVGIVSTSTVCRRSWRTMTRVFFVRPREASKLRVNRQIAPIFR